MPTIGVVPEARGLGIAAVLTNAFCKEASARGFRFAWALCAPDNRPIHRVFEKRGWVAQPGRTPADPIRFSTELPVR